MKVSRDRKYFNMALCEKTKIFMTTVNGRGKTDQCQFLSGNSIHLDISIKTETAKLNGMCVVDHLQKLQANYKLSKNHNTKNSVMLKQNLPFIILTPCDSNATKSSVLPINKDKEEEELSLNLGTDVKTPKQDLPNLILSSCSSVSVSVKSELTTHKEENECDECQFKLTPVLEELPLSSSGMDLQTPKQVLSNSIQKTSSCSSYDSKSLMSPVKEDCSSLSDKSRNLKRTLQVQIERLPKELVDKLLMKYNESVEHSKSQCNEELPNETASNFKHQKRDHDYKLKQLQIKPSYVLLKQISVTDTDNVRKKESKSEDKTDNCTGEIKPQETSYSSRNENNTDGESNERLTSTDISSSQMEQIQEKSSLNSSNQDSENVTKTTNNGSILYDNDNVTQGCQSQMQEKPDCLLQLPLPSESSDTLHTTNSFQRGKQNRKTKRNSDISLSTLIHDKVISRRSYNKTAKLPKTSHTYTKYEVNTQHNINNGPRKHKYQSNNINAKKVNKNNLQQRHNVKQTLHRSSTDQCKIKSKSTVADLVTIQNQTVNKKMLAFKKSKDQRKPYTRNKIIKTTQELGAQLPKEKQCKTEKSFLISRKRKSLQVDVEGTHQKRKPYTRNKIIKTTQELGAHLPKEKQCKTEKSFLISRNRKSLQVDLEGTRQKKCISYNNKENNRSAVKTKKLSLQNHLEQQISTDQSSITELQEDKRFNQVPIQSNNSLEKTTLSENHDIKQKHLKMELKKNTQLVRTAMQCNIPMVYVRNKKLNCQKVFDSYILIDHRYERKSQKNVTQRNFKKRKQLHERRKDNFQPQTLAALALQTFFGRHAYK